MSTLTLTLPPYVMRQVYAASHQILLTMRLTNGRSSYCDPFRSCPTCTSLISATLRSHPTPSAYSQSLPSPSSYSQTLRLVCTSGFHDELSPHDLLFTSLPPTGGTFEFGIGSELADCDSSTLPDMGEAVVSNIIVPSTPSSPPLPPLPPHISTEQPPSVLLPSSLPDGAAPPPPPFAPLPPSSPMRSSQEILVHSMSELRALTESAADGSVMRVALSGGRFRLDGQPLRIKNGNLTISGNLQGERSVLDGEGRSMSLSVEGVVSFVMSDLTITATRGAQLSLSRAWVSGCEIVNTTGRVFSLLENSDLSLSRTLISHVTSTSPLEVSTSYHLVSGHGWM